MKYLLVVAFAFLFFSCSNENPKAEQEKPPIRIDTNLLRREAVNPYASVDVSPMDVAYLPEDFPKKKMDGRATGAPVARVIYSRPHRQDRKIFGSLLKWGELWRLGANEATELEIFQPVTIQNKAIPPGRYTLYAIPFENKWTVFLSKETFTWGLRFNPENNIASFDLPVTIKDQLIEFFTIAFQKTSSGADMVMAWESSEVRLPIKF